MLKLELKLSKKLILQDGKYDPEMIFRSVDRAFEDCNLQKTVLDDGTCCYTGTGKKNDFANFGRLITSLRRKEWFMPYVEKWIWYNSDRGKTEDDFSVEDVLYYYTKKRSA